MARQNDRNGNKNFECTLAAEMVAKQSFCTFSLNLSAVRYIKTLPPPGTMPIS